MWAPKKESGKDKPSKVPYSYQIDPETGKKVVRYASCDDPDTWMPLDEAEKLLKSKPKEE